MPKGIALALGLNAVDPKHYGGRSVKLVQNHHTYLPGYAQFTGGNHFGLLEGMEHFHMAERGFSEIAQNLTSFPDGTVAVCRSIDKVPCGIKGANQEGICLENLGNFDGGGDAMTPAHRDAVVKINALLCREFSLLPSLGSIVYHHWYDLNSGKRTGGPGTTKTCPGTAFFSGNSMDAATVTFIPLVAQTLAQRRFCSKAARLWPRTSTSGQAGGRSSRWSKGSSGGSGSTCLKPPTVGPASTPPSSSGWQSGTCGTPDATDADGKRP